MSGTGLSRAGSGPATASILRVSESSSRSHRWALVASKAAAIVAKSAATTLSASGARREGHAGPRRERLGFGVRRQSPEAAYTAAEDAAQRSGPFARGLEHGLGGGLPLDCGGLGGLLLGGSFRGLSGRRRGRLLKLDAGRIELLGHQLRLSRMLFSRRLRALRLEGRCKVGVRGGHAYRGRAGHRGGGPCGRLDDRRTRDGLGGGRRSLALLRRVARGAIRRVRRTDHRDGSGARG